MKTQETGRIRVAAEQDRDAILAVHMNAFGEDEGPVIVKLVDEMLDDASGDPMLSLVAETDAGLVGHLLFTSVKIEPDHSQVSTRILAPLAVVQNRQRQGIGARLTREGLSQLKASGVNLVFVLGYQDYYSRFGFKPAGAQGLQATYPIPPQNADAWMVAELTPGTIENCEGTIRCSDALNHPKYWIE
ncbi:GNAT family N-acetyltransferase [Aporhodopirellula aestuarii]|uniref:N-acetyltransferase n=1 Tax=Aporhodopirellula aestuarii TaxID=2950107 RepID=A0ABT0U1B7_9BACT|nr:N-acetyltransferase [Aporhodopirellula aestuarii]MCM2370647.1 N-acetyltransferase [Aporhodopirellula aestuarii]